MIVAAIFEKQRLIYLSAAIVVAAIALTTRRFAADLPDWNKLYLGDVLWATALFFLICTFFPCWSLVKLVIVGVLFSWAVEFSQLYQPEWLMAIRRSAIGGLILGRGFLWSDIFSYTAGILIGAILKFIWERKQ